MSEFNWAQETPDEKHARWVAELAEQTARSNEQLALLLAESAQMAAEHRAGQVNGHRLRRRPPHAPRVSALGERYTRWQRRQGCAVCAGVTHAHSPLCANCRIGSLEWQREQATA